MASKRELAMHGALVCRVVDRMMQFRFDRAKHMIDSKDFDGPDHLNRFAEATALVAIVRAAKLLDLPRDYETNRSDDVGSYFRLYGLTEGHTLTKQDILDIETTLAEYNDEISDQADKATEWRNDALREVGGEELVKVVADKDQAVMSSAIDRVMAKFRTRTKEINAESLRRCVKSPGDSRGSCLACGADSDQACLLAPEVA